MCANTNNRESQWRLESELIVYVNKYVGMSYMSVRVLQGVQMHQTRISTPSTSLAPPSSLSPFQSSRAHSAQRSVPHPLARAKQRDKQRVLVI